MTAGLEYDEFFPVSFPKSESTRVSQLRFASFAIAIPLYRIFDYSIPTDLQVQPGCRFKLPFSSGSKTGLMLECFADDLEQMAQLHGVGQ